jgi:hypothetical protein
MNIFRLNILFRGKHHFLVLAFNITSLNSSTRTIAQTISFLSLQESFFDTSSLLLIPFNKARRVQDFTNIFPNLNDFLEGPESSCRKTFRK